MKKKKVLTIVLCCVLALLIIAGGIVYSKLPHALSYNVNKVESIGSAVKVFAQLEDSVSVMLTEDRDFKIIAFTDMHLDGDNSTSTVTMTNFVNNIIKEKPDLVILGGDNVTSGLNRKRAHQLAQCLENLGVYWCGVLGNHEGDNNWSISRSEMTEIFASYDHCLMLSDVKEDVWGDFNYTVNIFDSEKNLLRTFFFMDTGDEINDEIRAEYDVAEGRGEYDGLKTSQVEWYKERAAALKEERGNVKTTLVVHIPLYQYRDMAPETEGFKENGAVTEGFVFGGQLEKVCATCYDSGIFAAIKEIGTTDTVFCGHDHLNDFGVMCEDVLLSYFQPSGYGSYTALKRFGYEEKDWLQGYTLLTIDSEGELAIEHHRNSESLGGSTLSDTDAK